MGIRSGIALAHGAMGDKSLDQQHVDYLTPNETHLRILNEMPPDGPRPTLELAQQLLERGETNSIVTRGENEALASDDDAQCGIARHRAGTKMRRGIVI